MIPIINHEGHDLIISEKSSLLEQQQQHGHIYNKYIKFIDSVLCKTIHNPIITSLIILISISLIQSFQISQLITTTSNQSFVFIDDYIFDIISNLINILFIIRFQYFIRFPLICEIILFITQNIICLNLLFNNNFNILSLLNWNSIDSIFFTSLKIFLIIQIIFPYIILIINIFDYKHSEGSIHSFLSDCNNNYLPIFISHSFLFINYNFPLILLSSNHPLFTCLKSNLIFIFKIASFSFKFYIIYKFILYEIIMILFNKININDYSVFYKPQREAITEKEQQQVSTTTTNSFEKWSNHLMITTCSIITLIDLLFITISLYLTTSGKI
ncbi:hypothetical protein DFJ63DRAFT_333882 [Scheffersomyces coipomensis]|uniref:uncharacterized protein n=1 Tax=Scheffersomyces coipomensis TaxID=1788519 RepID=UPI00315D3743